MKKIPGALFAVVLLLLAVVLLYTVLEGKTVVRLFGMRIVITAALLLKSIAIVLFAGNLSVWRGKVASLIAEKLFFFPKDTLENKISFLFTGASIFLCAGIILGLYDAFFDPETLRLTVFTPITASWNERGARILTLILYYSLPSFLIGFSMSALSSFVVKTEKISAFLICGAFLGFALVFRNVSFIRIEPIGSISVTDAILYVVVSLFVLLIVPRLLIRGSYYPAVMLFFVSVFLLSAFFAAGHFENKKIVEKASKNHTRILLITMDTTRADHLSVGGYDYEKNTSPGLREIGKEGVVFSRTYSEVSTTEPSHTSILTGTYPRTHGLLKNGDKITNPNLDFLQSILKRNGFTTAAITSRTLFAAEELGWPEFDYESYPRTRKHRAKRREIFVADYAFKRAKDWIDKNYDKDFFLFVHFWDPHWPYIPPAPHRKKFNSGFKGYETRPTKRSFIKEKNKYKPDELAYTVSMYDGEISYTDKYVTKLVRYLENKIPDSSERPLIIITADHGDVMGELQDKYSFVFDHGETLNFGETYIPLIIKWEGQIKGNDVFDDLVESVDIAPTVLELLGIRGKYKFDGRSFASLLRDEEYAPKQALFAQKRPYSGHPVAFVNAPEYAVTTKDWRLIINEVKGNELYDSANDIFEEKNVASEHPDVVEELLGLFDEWKDNHPPAKLFEGKMSKKKTDVLKSLGYIQ